MKVEMIGTGAIFTRYNSSCALINDNMLLDVPNGTLKQLLKKECEVEKIRTIVITHMHGDHIADLPFLLLYLVLYKKVQETITILGPKGIEKIVKNLFNDYYYKIELIKDRVKYIEVENEKEYEVNQYDIKAFSVLHGELKTVYGYVVNHQLGFSGDTGLCDGLEKIVKESDISIVDSSRIVGNNDHAGINDIEYLEKKYHKEIIATHLQDITRAEWEKKNLEQVIIPEDGYIFEI